MKRRCDLLNYLIHKKGYTSYLEIGVDDPRRNYDMIKIDSKLGVDPAFKRFPSGLSFGGTSDQFFELNKEEFRVDIIFIDGLHEEEQVYRDITNSFLVLKPEGTIVMHDCLPRTEIEQHVPRQQDVWTGDVWKAFVRFRESHRFIKMRTVDMDFGIGVLTVSATSRPFCAKEELTFSNYQKNRKEWMNVISVEDFLKE